MLNNLLDRIGEFNPQLLRELKSRLSWRNMGITALVSFLVQGMVLIAQYSKLPVLSPNINEPYHYSKTEYCFSVPYSTKPPFPSNCKLDAFNNVLIDWPKWWGHVSIGISTVMFIGLLAGGVYLLASNFGQEQRRGTLDFIRLTPQRAGSIIGGKLLGVPILVYLATALAFPLQIHAVQQAQVARINVLSWDLLMVSMAMLLYLTAILATMWFKAQSILLAGITLGLGYCLIYLSLMWYGKREYEFIPWYGLELGNQVYAYLLYTGMASAGIYWLYQAIRRRYSKPTATVLSKKQSYLWSGMFHLALMGFAAYTYGDRKNAFFHLPFGLDSGNSSSSMITSIFALLWLMLLVPLLLPSQQSLVEWSRQRPVNSTKGRSLLADLIGHEKSPAMLAIAINMAIAAMIWLTPTLLGLSDYSRMNPKILLGILITTALVVIYSTIAHWGLFWKVNQRHAWTAGIVGGLIFAPLLLGAFMGGGPGNPVFLFSPFLWMSMKEVPGFVSLGVFLILLGGTSWLNLRLWRVLKKVGRSESFQHLATT